ncbi:MAG TPA: PilN domain-containing protein [Terriglobia bacterium]|nr:PilN domain-containing protein [Terriglobia bacterium]
MMKINLLGEGAPAGRKAASPSSSSQLVMVFIVTLAVAMSIVGFLYFYWNNQVHHEQDALSREQIRQKELAAVRTQNQQYQNRLKQLEERINTIQKLQTSRQGPVDLMTRLGSAVNSAQDLYLLQVTPEGKVLHIRGQAQTVRAIAQFIEALDNSPQFANVHLQQYYQDDQYGRTSFKFNLDCAYAPSEAAPPAAGKEPGARPAATGGR